MGAVAGKVALVTGAARGQGRAHAVRLAEEGADVIAVDIAGPVETVPFPGATEDDLAETRRLVAKSGRKVIAAGVDVRDPEQLTRAVEDGVRELGRLDIVVANAGIFGTPAKVWEMSDALWQTTVDVNLTGVFNTVRAAVPHVIATGEGGSVIITSSAAGLKGVPNYGSYAASKHGVLGLARTLAMELAEHRIRVNTVHPGNVDTDMIINDTTFRVFRPDLEHPSKEDVEDSFASTNLLPVPWVEPSDIANAVVWLASDEAKFVTGVALPVDAGMNAK
ncbi:mycofactocin-coupled SDR family oxidoreductase [Amycolatopsis circi]|uniref:mycofactocin-coupled SDR family oxidoreductase n=1 Tax=Amycolatopsis circi TaxID=871959 RepID=UPI000E283C13|nr:mycofactocin-coupled SDR family oxidoreductase [Amycolatopsis circi]